MKSHDSIIVLFFLVLSQSCISQNRKMESQKYTLLAEDLIKNNLSYTPKLNDSNRIGFEKALSFLDKAIALDSLNIRAYKDKQTVFINLGKEMDTLTVFKILELKPDFAEEYVVLGNIYEGLNEIQSAKEAYEKAKSIYLSNRSSNERNLNLIVLEFLITNDKREALEKLKQFPINDPDFKKALMAQIDGIEKGRMKR